MTRPSQSAEQGPREQLLTPAQVAMIFGVHAKTVVRWANAKKITSLRTPGGHRRFRASEIRAFLASSGDA